MTRLFRTCTLWSAVATLICSFCAFGQSEPSDAQYAIYSAYLRLQLDGKHGIENLRLGEGGSVISPEIKPTSMPQDAKGQLEIKSHLPDAENETLESLAKCSADSWRLLPKLNLPVEYKLIPPKLVKSRSSYIELSCIGMNGAGTQAVFFVSRLHCDCAVGLLVLMRKSEDGSWTIRKEIQEWIA